MGTRRHGSQSAQSRRRVVCSDSAQRTMNDSSATPRASPPQTAQADESARAAQDAASLEPAADHVEEELADDTDNPIPTRAFATLPMVGLGGSAGGLAALQ